MNTHVAKRWTDAPTLSFDIELTPCVCPRMQRVTVVAFEQGPRQAAVVKCEHDDCPNAFRQWRRVVCKEDG